MQQYQLDVSKKIDGKYQPVGDIVIHYPLLSDLGFDIQPKAVVLDDKQQPVNQGLPEYEDDKHQYCFDSVFSAVKADARNKLVSGTANLKDGASIAETVEELIAVAERDGAALKAMRSMLNAFKSWLPSTGKATKTCEAILALASNRKSLALQPADKKSKFLNYVTTFAGTLTPEQITEFARSLQGLEVACEAVDALDDM